MVLFWILLATIIDGLLGLVGVFTLIAREKVIQKIIFALVAFSAGTMLSGGFFHLLAESLAQLSPVQAFGYMFVGFILFFLIEKLLHWHHCHAGHCEEHQFTYLVLIGDGVHNVIDGLIIAASFLVSLPFGFLTTLLIIAHEIPQELGDFGVLVYGGFSRRKAVCYSFIAQMTAVIGGLLGFMLAGNEFFVSFLLPFTAGGFFYIGASDLIPELHKELSLKKSMISFVFFVIGILFILWMKLMFGG